ncbi:class I SAM-dependent methyltransferase [Streptomyces kunmingensis]|uniref:Class I SAM-dependent methyltransferase n=1 Tax=Streptomyces kunmingensis TaxID=68225 RepID=A0ABU6C5X4_9ACTN|nr:class I SAM-dependent methyltransferase [Streptomyces kunmingensis]MEB3960112.1 class I SAM-dependent methyltransferase [Streptomyces kunmingensis]
MSPTVQAVAARRPAYLTELARGTERFHEPPRPDCPWCGSTKLRTRLRTTDLLQHKPGTFTVDQCRACAHSFQNPRLTPEGLDFYYRDFYDGLHAGQAEKIFGAQSSAERHRRAVHALARFIEPESWLDVGTGRAHFPAVARKVLPYTSFDGLDLGAGVEEGRRRGRIEEAHRGTLRGLAAQLAGRYDAMSMFHHLEHSLDPREELKAAHRVLRPGGHLMIEVPDPESRYAKLLRKWWVPYFQPQHLHFIPLANLRAELGALGFTVVAVDRREPHVPLDLSAACALLLGRFLPRRDDPWRAKAPGGFRRGLRRALTYVAAPAFVACYAADRLLAPLVSRTRFSNAYRIIARRNPDAA